MGRKSRARRVLGVIGAIVGTTVTFVAATATAAIVHLDAPAVRRLVATQVTGILRGQFAGDVAVERIGGLGLRGIAGVRFRVKDPTGMQVLLVDGARVRLRSLDAARSALFGKGDIVIPVELVSIDHVDLALDSDPAGNLRIANAFASRTPPSPPSPTNPNARGVRVDAPDVVLHAAWVHGQPPGAIPLDVEIHDLVAHGHYDAKRIKADLDRVDLVGRGLPRGVDPRGRVGGHFTMPSASGRNMGVTAAFDGVVAGIPTRATFGMDGQQIDAVVDGRDPSGEGVRSMFGEVSPREAVTLHADAHGTLPNVDVKAQVALGRGTVDLDGHLDFTDGTKTSARIAVRHVDLHGVVPSAPASDLGLDTRATVMIGKDGALAGTIVLTTLPGSLAGQALPIVEAKGAFTKEAAQATGTVIDPRAKADFALDARDLATSPVATGHVHAVIADLSRLPLGATPAKGHATIDVDGSANIGAKTLLAKAHVVAGSLSYGAQTVDNATMVATAEGSFAEPRVDVGVHAGGIVAGGQKIDVVDVRGRVEVGAVTTIRNAQVDLVKDRKNVSVTARRVQFGGPGTYVDGVIVTGLGEPLLADFSHTPGETRVTLDGPSIDVARVAALTGQAKTFTGGHLAIKGQVALRGATATGTLHASIDRFSTGQVHDASADLDARFDGRRLNLDVKAALAEAGTFELATHDIVLGGSPSDPASWKRAHGRAKFSANLDAAKLATLLPVEWLPVSELAGQLVIEGSLRRDSASVPPEMSIHAHTRGLVVAGIAAVEPPHDAVHGTEVKGVQPWRSQGIDASFDARVDATSGFGEVAFHAVDQKGTLIGFNAKSDLPYQRLVDNPGEAVALLEKTPFVARLVVPKRPLSEMPEIAGVRSIPGAVEVEVDITGTALDPKVVVEAHARDLRSPALAARLASNADLMLMYDGKQASLDATVSTEKHEALHIGAEVDVRIRDLLMPRPGEELAWGGSARVKLASFPLQTVNALADRRIRGHVSGEVVLGDLHKDAKLDARLAFADLKIGRAQYKSGTIAIVAQGGKLNVGARLEQTDGFADLSATTGLTWGDALVPALDTEGDMQAHLEGQGFRAAALLPFTGGALNELDGRIDANVTARIGANFQNPTLEGQVLFHDGTLQIAAIGEEYKNAKAKITFQPGGIIKVDDVFLEGTEGQLSAAAEAKTRGFGLASAKASLSIPRNRPLDLAIQGQGLGALSGSVTMVATNSADGKNLKVAVDVPSLNLELPQKLKAGVQALAPQEDIRVGVYRYAQTFVKLPLDKQDLQPIVVKAPASTTLDVDVKLGEVTVRRGSQARVILSGAPHIKITNTTEVSGQIQVVEGRVDVQGKTFEIEQGGTITFQPHDTSNPIVNAKAGWEAEDGTHVYAAFVGPVKTGKVTLSSDPARPRNEILAVILFGTADGAQGAPKSQASTGGSTRAATSAVGGLGVTQGLTEAMDDLTGLQATAKIDTSRSANPAPELEVQIARRVSLAFEHVLGTPPISEPDTNLATVDWRFRANWSLKTTFGDRGLLETDAVWQKRY